MTMTTTTTENSFDCIIDKQIDKKYFVFYSPCPLDVLIIQLIVL